MRSSTSQFWNYKDSPGQTILPEEEHPSTDHSDTGGRALTQTQQWYYSTTNGASQSSRCSQQVESSQKQSEENFTAPLPCVSGPGSSILLTSQGRCIRSSRRIGFFINDSTWKSLLRQVRKGLLTIFEEIFETFKILETLKKSTWESVFGQAWRSRLKTQLSWVELRIREFWEKKHYRGRKKHFWWSKWFLSKLPMVVFCA